MSIKKAYNSWAIQYDTNENKTRDLDARSTIETLGKYDFNIVIELGCGTGKNTQWLVTKADRIIGLDFSEEMLNIARKKISSKKVEFKQTDINDRWPIEDKFADLVTLSLILEHIENLDPVFRQAYQKLKPGGLLFLSELHPFRQYMGSKAKFATADGLKELEAYTHHISEYIDSAYRNEFQLAEMGEWFDDGRKDGVPRLISFIFRK